MSYSEYASQAKLMTRKELFHMFRRNNSGTDNSAVKLHNSACSEHDVHAKSLTGESEEYNAREELDNEAALDDVQEVAQQIFTNLPPEFASLYRQEAEKKGLTVSDDAMKEASSAFLKSFWEQCP